MSPRLLQPMLWGCTVALSLGAVTGWAGGRPRVTATAQAATARLGVAPVFRAISDDSIDDAAGATSDHDPFRLTREPSAIPYVAGHEGMVAASGPPTPPKPPLALSGIVGPPWVAVLEGIPGHAGSVLARSGDTLGRPPLALLVVRRVGQDTVIVRGADTTWTLTVYHPWK